MCPKRRQTMLFSATMTEEVDALVQLSLNSPVRLSADPSTKRPVTLSEECVLTRVYGLQYGKEISFGRMLLRHL
jgi:ATP-dependent RNA helicase DDX27